MTRTLRDAAETEALGAETGGRAEPGEVFALVGELGAGKTQFVKGFAAGLGYAGDVTSPTFTLLHEYRGGRLEIYHFDFYRVEAADELLALGWDEYLDAGGVIVAEWADKFAELLPAGTRWLQFSIESNDTRTVTG